MGNRSLFCYEIHTKHAEFIQITAGGTTGL